MTFQRVGENLFRGSLDPAIGSLRDLWTSHGAEVIIGHPTFKNIATIGRQLQEGIRGAPTSFDGRRVSFVVSDGTLTHASGDSSTLDEAQSAAAAALATLDPTARALVQCIVTPYEGYGGDRTPGKGSALKMIFDEMEDVAAELLILLDGDLRNDMALWHRVFARVEAQHRTRFGERPFFVTARYARHFVDASLTRFVVGPLTTLMGRYVPGGISGDIVLSASAVAHERQSAWTEERRKYGTDISTTFDNVAHPETVIYEVYLGAKLHDITDEGKLSVMPGEVIGAALERLRHWESVDGRVSARLTASEPLAPLEVWTSKQTGIDFVDPGMTDVFDVDVKMATLTDKLDAFIDDIRLVQGDETADGLLERREALQKLRERGEGELAFLGVDTATWIVMLQRAVARVLATGELEAPKRSLNYLYTAAFLEFVREKLAELGLTTLAEIRSAQSSLGVAPERAEAFYAERVDAVTERLARDFYARRRAIADSRSEVAHQTEVNT